MTETVGTNTAFDLPVDEIIELALESVDAGDISAKDAKLARTSLNLIFTDIQNKADFGPLAQVETITVPLVSGSANDYVLSADVLAVHEAVIRVSTSGGYTDINIERDTYDDWIRLSNKSQPGRPTRFLVDRQRDGFKLSFYNVPDNSSYSFYAWVTKRIPDVDAQYQLVGIPRNYINAVVEGLRYYMAKLKPNKVPLQEREVMRRDYQEALQSALDYDRERTDFEIYPQLPRVLR